MKSALFLIFVTFVTILRGCNNRDMPQKVHNQLYTIMTKPANIMAKAWDSGFSRMEAGLP